MGDNGRYRELTGDNGRMFSCKKAHVRYLHREDLVERLTPVISRYLPYNNH